MQRGPQGRARFWRPPYLLLQNALVGSTFRVQWVRCTWTWTKVKFKVQKTFQGARRLFKIFRGGELFFARSTFTGWCGGGWKSSEARRAELGPGDPHFCIISHQVVESPISVQWWLFKSSRGMTFRVYAWCGITLPSSIRVSPMKVMQRTTKGSPDKRHFEHLASIDALTVTTPTPRHGRIIIILSSLSPQRGPQGRAAPKGRFAPVFSIISHGLAPKGLAIFADF